MSQWDKLIKRLYTIPGDMRFEELKKILIHYGYTDNNPRGGSSHHSGGHGGSHRSSSGVSHGGGGHRR